MRGKKNIKQALVSFFSFIKQRPDIQWLAIVYLSFVIIFWQFNRRLIVPVESPVNFFIVFADSALVTLPMLWIRKRWLWSFWVVLSVLSLYFIANTLYACTYYSLMSLSTLCMWGNLDKMVIESAVSSLSLSDVSYILIFLSTLALWFCRYRHKIKKFNYSRKIRVAWVVFTVVLIALAQIKSTITYRQKYAERNGDETGFVGSMVDKIAGKNIARHEYFDVNGLFPYLGFLVHEYFSNGMVSEKDYQLMTEYINGMPDSATFDKLADSIPPCNFILIVVESLESWAIDYSQNGKYAMPYLHSLAAQSQCDSCNVFYSPNLLSQVSVGHSSDGQMIILTGVLPLRNDVAAGQFYDNDYPTIFRAIEKKYNTKKPFEITCDDAKMWNQGHTYIGYGFEKLYGWTSFDPEEKLDWYNRDKPMFNMALDKISKSPEQYACMLVTLELHQPYDGPYKSNTWIDAADNLSVEARNYLAKAANTDRSIKEFIEGLKRIGRYENTVIAITGDHYSYGMPNEKRVAEERNTPHYLPLVVLNSPLGSQYNEQIGGQIDIYPTLLDILGVEDYGWRGVGHSLLRPGHPNAALNCEGQMVGLSDEKVHNELEEAWKMSQIIIRSNYFATHLP